MSRIGKKPINVPAGVTIKIAAPQIEVSGPKGSLKWLVPPEIAVEFDEPTRRLKLTRISAAPHVAALFGLSRALVANMVAGVHQGFRKRLLIYGTGYSCNLVNGLLHVNAGFMGRGSKDQPQFAIKVPEGLHVTVEVPAARGESDPAKLVVEGCDKQLLGQFCADLRALRPPEPYKGKGIRYDDEVVRRKAGKAVAGGTA